MRMLVPHDHGQGMLVVGPAVDRDPGQLAHARGAPVRADHQRRPTSRTIRKGDLHGVADAPLARDFPLLPGIVTGLGQERLQQSPAQAGMLDAHAERTLAVLLAVVVNLAAALDVDDFHPLDGLGVRRQLRPSADPAQNRHAAGEQRQGPAVGRRRQYGSPGLPLDQSNRYPAMRQGDTQQQPGVPTADDDNVRVSIPDMGCLCRSGGSPSRPAVRRAPR